MSTLDRFDECESDVFKRATHVLVTCLTEYDGLPQPVKDAVDAWKGSTDEFFREAVALNEAASRARRAQFGSLLEGGSVPGPVSREVLPPLSAIKAAEANIPAEHVEWALKVHKMAPGAQARLPNPVLERVFDKGETQAREFFTRTQNVWNMRVNAGEASAYEVVLGVQDARKHKKKGSFREVEKVMCTGGLK